MIFQDAEYTYPYGLPNRPSCRDYERKDGKTNINAICRNCPYGSIYKYGNGEYIDCKFECIRFPGNSDECIPPDNRACRHHPLFWSQDDEDQ
jgi:hypothetical protein